ncbi:MAG: OmpA/MotB domain protein [Rhodospirillales bacterium]|nr:OmpA/MotB domain protein [Rhodospirillales bacterium]
MHRTAIFLATACVIASSSAIAQTSQGTLQAQAGPGEFVVYFDLGQTRLDSEDLTVIASAAEEFRRTGATRVVVRGHTDTSGSADLNRTLSERRARSVAEELALQGVPADAITTDAAGETALAVETGDEVVEANNRRVEIAIEEPAPAPAPAPAPVAEPTPAPAPPVVAAAPEEREPDVDRGIFTLGAYYGFNMRDEGDDDGDDDGRSHLAGLNLSFDYLLTDWLSVGAEQAAFYNFGTDDDGFGGRTAAGVNFTLGNLAVIPYVGANIGYIYGSGIEDDYFAGPEIGIALGPVNAKLAYDMPFDRSWDEGIVSATVGLGIRF